MARIYNYMPEAIFILHGSNIPGLNLPMGQGGVPRGSLRIDAGARSESISWPDSDAMTVYMSGNIICLFNFGFHAQIQGGNYCIIAPNSFTVYDSNHNVINTGTP